MTGDYVRFAPIATKFVRQRGILRWANGRPQSCGRDWGKVTVDEFKARGKPVEQRARSDHVDNDFDTALACSMNNFANGPGVRFFTVRMAIASRVAGIFAGRIFNPTRRELN